jgi:hypothetical protein
MYIKTELNSYWWPSSVIIHLPYSTSHSFTVLSLLPVAKIGTGTAANGLVAVPGVGWLFHLMTSIAEECPLKAFTESADFDDHRYTTSSSAQLANSEPAGSHLIIAIFPL